MAGPIQTAISQALGSLAGAVIAGKKTYEKNERQIEQKEAEQETSKAAEAYKTAQQKGLTSPEDIIFDKKGQALATYEELASIMAKQSMSNFSDSRKRSKESIQARRDFLKNKGGAQ